MRLSMLNSTNGRPRVRISAASSRAGKTNSLLLTWMFLLILAAIYGLGFLWHKSQTTGARVAPGAGTIIPMGPREVAALDYAWGDRSGFIVWSSTMYGQHDLVRMEWPSGRIGRLTRNPAVDTTPRISPNGKQVVFARSRQEWVSLRNREEWDIWILNLKGGSERLLAERGADPCWTRNGKSVVFHRGGRELIQVNLRTSKQTVLLTAPKKTIWTGPSVDPEGNRAAVTVQGWRPRTAIYSIPKGEETRMTAGCGLSFAPDGNWLVLVDEGKKEGNGIGRVDPSGANLEKMVVGPGYWSHEVGPQVSNDSGLLVFGAASEGGELDTADYEIFLWQIGSSSDDVARVSFHTGNDQWPDAFVYPKH